MSKLIGIDYGKISMRLVNGGRGKDGESRFAVCLSCVGWHVMVDGRSKLQLLESYCVYGIDT